MYQTISGNYTMPIPTATGEVSAEEVYLLVNTSSVACNITLPAISALGGFLNTKVFVVDQSNNAATNPITIIPGGSDTIAGNLQFTLTKNGSFGEVTAITTTEWAIFDKKTETQKYTLSVTTDGQTAFTLPFYYATGNFIEIEYEGEIFNPTNEKTGALLETYFTISGTALTLGTDFPYEAQKGEQIIVRG